MKPNSTEIDPSEFFDLMEQMTEEDQDKYVKLMKGCTRRLNKIKDPVEIAMQLVVCGKENSNEVIRLFGSYKKFRTISHILSLQYFYLYYQIGTKCDRMFGINEI